MMLARAALRNRPPFCHEQCTPMFGPGMKRRLRKSQRAREKTATRQAILRQES
ncbi:MAG TPA: hypothetical protein VFQ44_02085 [Streptosporangiaceae bacterium]|nr:hypothetical protein [Streptosporangiaceae bacterium]